MAYIGRLKKGSLLTSTGTNNTEIIAGSNTQVLTADSTQPNGIKWADPTVLSTVDVAHGGTGQTTLTNHGVLVGAGTSPITQLATGTAGQILQSGGASADPAYSTSTYPTTNAINTLLYASAANVMSALATANGGVLTTSATGVPSIDTTNFRVASTGVQMKGNNTGTTPPAGFIGEQIRATVSSGSPVNLPNNTSTNITSISLTAGIWDVSGVVVSVFTGTSGFIIGSVNGTSATLGTSGDNSIGNGIVATTPTLPVSIPAYRVTTNSTITYYLVAQANFSTGACTGYGRISATRVG